MGTAKQTKWVRSDEGVSMDSDDKKMVRYRRFRSTQFYRLLERDYALGSFPKNNTTLGCLHLHHQ